MLHKTILKNFSIALFAGSMMMAFSPAAHAIDEATEIALGKMEYMTACAACHGENGRGGGPVAEVMTQKPTNLTQLSANFEGKYPGEFLYRVIDGREMINPHGDRQMPVWGYRFLAQSLERAADIPHDVDAQAMVHGRIVALVKYIESLQEK